jgi:hypothetical protein
MATKVVWGNFASQQSSYNSNKKDLPKLEFIQLGKKAIGKKYKFRLLGSPVSYWKYVFQIGTKWNSVIRLSQDDCDLKNYNLKAKETFAINVLDRADNKIKILEGPRTIFLKFDDYFRSTNFPPGGPMGADFELTVTGKKGKDFYVTEIKGRTPFTEQEKELLQKTGLFALDKIFKVTPDEKVKEVVSTLESTSTTSKPKEASKEEDEELETVPLADLDLDSAVSVPNLEEGGEDLTF